MSAEEQQRAQQRWSEHLDMLGQMAKIELPFTVSVRMANGQEPVVDLVRMSKELDAMAFRGYVLLCRKQRIHIREKQQAQALATQVQATARGKS